jgi:hypothetical protein
MPALLLQQDWALGLIGLKFAHHMFAGIPEGRLLGRPLRDTFASLVWPPLQAVAALLALPYALTRGLLPLLPLLPELLQVGAVLLNLSSLWPPTLLELLSQYRCNISDF